MLPGKKDFVSVKLADGKIEHRQKRWLLINIGEAHQLFTMETEMDIGQSKFAELRPTEVLPMTSNNQKCASASIMRISI